MEEHVSSPGPSLVEMEKQEDLDGERDEDEQRAPNSEDMEIDHVLEEAAHRKNLSVLNVKSILRHVLKDKRVFALVQKQAAEQEGMGSDQQWNVEDIVTYEPKLTRSWVRQELMERGGLSPENMASLSEIVRMKSPAKQKDGTLLESSTVTDDSSDEEYNPVIESSNEESDDQSGNSEEEENEEEEDDEEEDNDDEENGCREVVGVDFIEGKRDCLQEEDVNNKECVSHGPLTSQLHDTTCSNKELNHQSVSDEDRTSVDPGNTVTSNLQSISMEPSYLFPTNTHHQQLPSISPSSMISPANSFPLCFPTTSSTLSSSSITTTTTATLVTPSILPAATSITTTDTSMLVTSSSFLPVATSITTTDTSMLATSSSFLPAATSITTTDTSMLATSLSFLPAATSITTTDTSTLATSSSFLPAATSITITSTLTTPSFSPAIANITSLSSITSRLTATDDDITSTLLSSTTTTSVLPSSSSFSIFSAANTCPGSFTTSSLSSTTTSLCSAITISSLSGINLLPSTDSLQLPKLSSSSLVPPPDDALIHETAAFLASLSDVIQSPLKGLHSVSESPVKPTEQVREEEKLPLPLLYEEEEEIAKRTRSKLPLHDTSISSIEASFVPPDDDPPTPLETAEPMELEDDDLEWQNWLVDLFNPNTSTNLNDSVVSSVCGEEDGDDAEYNYLADQMDEEKEEFRDDRAVRISKKEVDDLLNEYLYSSASGVGGLLTADSIDLTSAYLLQSLGLQSLLLQNMTSTHLQGAGGDGSSNNSSVLNSKLTDTPQITLHQPENETYLSAEQTVQLHTQIQQHYQLLMQTFVLSRFEPSLVHIAQLAAKAVKELHEHLLDAKKSGDSVQTGLWSIPTLEEGLGLINRLDPYNEDAVKLVAAIGNPVRIPDNVQEILMTCHTFWTYPHLLPAVGFGSLSKEKPNTSNFTTEEDYLIVMGMHHYGSIKAWTQIQENLIPTKTAKQLQLRVKNATSKRGGDNVIKHYKQTKEVKIPYKEAKEGKGHDNILPDWIMAYHKKRLERDKKEAKKKEKLLEQNRKVTKMLDPYVNRLIAPAIPSSSLSGQQVAVGHTSRPGTSSKRNLFSQSLTAKDSKRQKLLYRELNTKDTFSDSIVQNLGEREVLSCVGSEENATQSFSEDNMELLLHAAGLEASSYPARFAYRFLNEVKASLIDGGAKRYAEFLDVLVQAGKEKMKPSTIYSAIKEILHPWPHLLRLFTEFLTMEDCIQSNAMMEKYEWESVKSFVSLLKEKFKDSPIKLDEVLKKLLSLDVPGVTVENVKEMILPLINAHEDLVIELRRFLFQLAPPPRSDDVYEEISLVGNNCEFEEWDGYEEVNLTDPPPPAEKSESTTIAKPSNSEQSKPSTLLSTKPFKVGKKQGPVQSSSGSLSSVTHKVTTASKRKGKITQKSSSSNLFKVPQTSIVRSQKCSSATQKVIPTVQKKSAPAITGGVSVTKSHVPVKESPPPVETGSVSMTKSRVPVKESVELNSQLLGSRSEAQSSVKTSGVLISRQLRNKQVSISSSKQEVSVPVKQLPLSDPESSHGVPVKPNKWTREEDRVILKRCLHVNLKPHNDACFRDIALQLNRKPEEIKSRYGELYELFQSSKSIH